ncbi:hypothetical protein EX895_001733 [Sporisorium graminicola]|uniref:RRM domain-containing protein n=1 Tax=Sporisorium graminicola TaxID=280036 RepID=A0A4U7L1S2_9BASI|nr:hypothetical protein EX895_001733 [Sporisorium graminicola]TKY89202.1 hypothetical protein EX895_001733 [Sporisorium graminicola]
MATDAPSQSMPPFNLSQYPSDDVDRLTGVRRSQLSRNVSSDEGDATVNLPPSSASANTQLGHESMGFTGMFNPNNNGSSNTAMSNSISSLHSNASSTTSGSNFAPSRTGLDQASRLRQTFNTARSSSPLSRPPLFSPGLLHEVERSAQHQVRSPSGSHPASSPPPRSNVTSPRYFSEAQHLANAPPHLQHNFQTSHQHSQPQHHHQQQHIQQQQQQHPSQQHSSNSSSHPPPPSHMSHHHTAPMHPSWQARNGGMGPLDFPPSAHPSGLGPSDRPHSSMSERSSRIHENAAHAMALGGAQSPVGSINKEPEFSIFVGDLSPDLREEDLVSQFLQPPAWPHNHPFASALVHAQQTQGIYQPGTHIGPAPFHSTKSAKIMTDPVTGVSKGYGFVRFALEADCNRALVEMQGVVVSPANGLSPGRPLRVSTATPKNRGGPPPPLLGPNAPGDPSQQHLQMPRPHNPAQSAGPSFLYGGAPGVGGPGARSEVVSPQPHLRQQSSPTHPSSLVSPISPASPYEGVGGSNMPASFGPLYGGFPGNVVDGPRDASPAGMARSHTPSSAPATTQQGGGGGNPGDSAADPNNTTVFVGGLSSLISEATLTRYFEHFGEITYVKIPPGKGCGFVQYVRKQDAENAIQRMNGFPILNSKIRLSWGRSQGDKAAAAAAQNMAQYAQLGALAGLSQSQLAQLVGLGNALSAVQAQAQAQAQGPVQRGPPGFGLGGAGGLANDPLSTLARQLAAANLGAGAAPPVHGSQGLPSMGQRAPLPSFLQSQQHQQQQHPPQLPHFQPQQQQQQQTPFRGQPGFASSQNSGLLPMGPNGVMTGPGYGSNGGGGGSSHSNQGFDFDQRGASSEQAFGPQDGSRSRPMFPLQQHQQQQPDDFSGMPPLSESELADALASLDFDETSRAALAQRLQAMQQQHRDGDVDGFGAGSGFNVNQGSANKRPDPFSGGYNRDPNAFMFSPFSPSDSPVVGGKDLPNSQSSSSSLHLSHRADEDGANPTKEATTGATGSGSGADR